MNFKKDPELIPPPTDDWAVTTIVKECAVRGISSKSVISTLRSRGDVAHRLTGALGEEALRKLAAKYNQEGKSLNTHAQSFADYPELVRRARSLKAS